MSSIDNSRVAALDLLESRPIRTLYGDCHEYLYRYQNEDVIALTFGEVTESAIPVRIHSACFAAHYMGSIECDCREQLDVTLRSMESHKSGVVIFLDQDGRGNGHAALMRSAILAIREGVTVGEAYERLGYPADARNYRAAALVLADLGVTHALLRTNNPEKISALAQAGIVVDDVEIVAPDAPWLHQYYSRKAEEGHRFTTVGKD